MQRKKFATLVLFTLSALVGTNSFAADVRPVDRPVKIADGRVVEVDTRPLRLTQGVMSLGGTLAFPVAFSADGKNQLGVQVNPTFGYFILDQVELNLGIAIESASAWSNRTGTPVATKWGVNLGGQYYFDTGSHWHPYVGARIGYAYQNGVVDTLSEQSLHIVVPAGVLLALNQHVGLNLGALVDLEFPKFAFGGVKVTPGYLGVNAYF